MANDQTPAEHDQTISNAPAPAPGSEAPLVASAARWMDDALIAWSEDNYAKVAVFAPLAVEHLGKAALWKKNPVLLIPVQRDFEDSLFSLATKPDLASPKLRTVSLDILFSRLERLLDDGLPIDKDRRKRMVAIRNGAMHVGSSGQASRDALLDSLALCDVLLKYLGEDPRAFYDDHHASVLALLDEKRTEVSQQVAAKRARARRRLGDLEERLGDEMFKQLTGQLEELAAGRLDPEDYGSDLLAIDATCPECGSKGRLFGHVDADVEIETDYESLGGGEYEAFPVPVGWSVTISPQVFACNVCELTLWGPEELSAGRLPASRHEIRPEDLGEDFDPAYFIETQYGLQD